MTVNNLEIPPNATIRQEYVKCGDPDCQNLQGPYLYAYWKQDKKLKKRYVGKNFEDFGIRRIAKEVKLKSSHYSKFIFIQQEAGKEEVSIDWAHSIHQQRMLKMMAIADNRHFSYQNEDDLVGFYCF